MAQSGYTAIRLYRSSTPGATPIAANLQNGEMALNYADGKLFYKDDAGVVQEFTSAADLTYYTIPLGSPTVDCSLGQYFTITVAGAASFSFTNVPAFPINYSMTIQVNFTSGTITWPAAVKWPKNVTPAPETGKTSLFMFVTTDGGTTWRAGSLLNFV